MDNYRDQLLILNLTNFIIYVYDSDNELIQNQGLYEVSDSVLEKNFTFGSVLSWWRIFETYLKRSGHYLLGHSFPLKMIGLGNPIPEVLIRRNGYRVFLMDENFRYVGCNDLFANDFSLNGCMDVIGKSDVEWLEQASLEKISSENLHVLKSGECVDYSETEIVLKNGQKKHIEISRYPVKDNSGKSRFIVGKYKLLSGKQDDDMVRFSDHKLLQFLMDNVTDTIYFKDLESKFIRINRAQANLIGVKSPEEAIGKSDFDYFNIEHAKKAFSDEMKIINEALPINRIEYVGNYEGKYRWLNSSKVPIFNHEGNIIGTAGITRDIDKMIRVEHRLKAERDLLQLLIDNIPSPIYFKDKESRFTRVNKAETQLLGAASNQEVIGKTDFDFYTKIDAEAFYADEQQIIETNKAIVNKVEQGTYDGGLRWFSTTKIPITDEDGELSGILGVSHDITDQVLVHKDLEIAKEKAEVASTAKSNFLSNMSHEIRTPMNGVIGMAEVLNMTELDQEQKKIVSLIIRSGNNLLNIINDILDFSKIESGKLEIEKIPIDLKSIIREVVEMMMFSANEKDIKFYYKIDPNIPELVIGDSLRLKQVLINLVSNAIKFTKEGEVVVKASFLGNSDNTHCVVFKVIDTGIGISPEEKSSLFEAFTQADASTSRKYGGTGLGLAISSRLIDMMGGKLDVISEKGKGSTFFFDLCFSKVVIDDYDKI
ncbi:MAG TPA: PAS domain-containing protein [Prolixibacteraceae bacterium]|nr:PAS domain-containing protein [Prolixibacteraceae bacterium]HPS11883.1 PAS domain-containing protein [Prolixibacteraceae bacterium]